MTSARGPEPKWEKLPPGPLLDESPYGFREEWRPDPFRIRAARAIANWRSRRATKRARLAAWRRERGRS